MTAASRAAAVGLSAAIVLAAPLGAQCPDGTPPPCDVRAHTVRDEPPPPEVRARAFLVLPFRNLTRLPDHEWLVDGSVALLVDGLGRWQEVTVVREGTLYQTLARHQLPHGEVLGDDVIRRLAAETGGWTVVTGDIVASGARTRIRARATDAATGTLVTQADEEVRDDEDVRETYERIALMLLGDDRLVLSPEWITARASTRSLDAYKLLVQGLTAYGAQADPQGALEAFREAVSIDSTFALGHALIALTLGAQLGLFDDPQALAAFATPAGEGNRAIQRAIALSARLPLRERQLVQGMSALFRGQFAEGRRALEALLAADSSDELAGLMAMVEYYDPAMIVENGRERRRGSLNQAARLAKWVTFANPLRHDAYMVLTRLYREAAGYWEGWIAGYRRELASLVDYAVTPSDVALVPLLGDSLELVQVRPIDSLRLLDADSVDAARARATAVARGWADQWVVAVPGDPRAHLWASHVLERAGDLDLASAEVETAERLAEGPLRNGSRRHRMVLWARMHRYEPAALLADSLWTSGYLPGVTAGLLFPIDGFDALAWTVCLSLHGGRIPRADSAYSHLDRLLVGSLRDGVDEVIAGALTGTLPRPSRQWWAIGHLAMPRDLLEQGVDSLLAGIALVSGGSPLARAVPALVRGAAEGMSETVRARWALQALEASAALERLGRTEEARALGEVAAELEAPAGPASR